MLRLRATVLRSFAILLTVLVSPLPAGDGGSGLRIVSPEDRRTFYRTRGREVAGRKVHLHVEAEVLRRKPRVFRGSDGRDWLEFANRTVPLVVDPKSPHWVQVSRHLRDASEFCLHGVVRIAKDDQRGLARLHVDTIQRAPGTWK